jgi:beta-lactamase regulating signal transducer with metallopeptidase domain
MNKTARPMLLITIGLAVALASAALASPTVSRVQTTPSTTAISDTEVITATAVHETEKVPGNTNIILLLGAILVVIIVTAIMWHRRDWEKN